MTLRPPGSPINTTPRPLQVLDAQKYRENESVRVCLSIHFMHSFFWNLMEIDLLILSPIKQEVILHLIPQRTCSNISCSTLVMAICHRISHSVDSQDAECSPKGARCAAKWASLWKSSTLDAPKRCGLPGSDSMPRAGRCGPRVRSVHSCCIPNEHMIFLNLCIL